MHDQKRTSDMYSFQLPSVSRRLIQRFVPLLLAVLFAGQSFFLSAQASPAKPLVEVYKSPSCGCCNEWIKHLQANGFEVKAFDKGNNAIRKELGMPLKYGSCHTAKVGGYAIEGHVPAREVHRLLKEKPKAIGLSVPEMPIGTPGMDTPEYGGQVDPYNVLLIRNDGSSTVYQAYTEQKNPGRR
jgi:hypothetical protein